MCTQNDPLYQLNIKTDSFFFNRVNKVKSKCLEEEKFSIKNMNYL